MESIRSGLRRHMGKEDGGAGPESVSGCVETLPSQGVGEINRRGKEKPNRW